MPKSKLYSTVQPVSLLAHQYPRVQNASDQMRALLGHRRNVRQIHYSDVKRCDGHNSIAKAVIMGRKRLQLRRCIILGKNSLHARFAAKQDDRGQPRFSCANDIQRS